MSIHICSDCDIAGDGHCSRCHGRGKTLPDKSLGKFRVEIFCPRCKGSGSCPTCGGTGEASMAAMLDKTNGPASDTRKSMLRLPRRNRKIA